MTSLIGFLADLKGGQKILKDNAQIKNIEEDKIKSLHSRIQAQFLQEFGFEGDFNVQSFYTDRINFKISAGDQKTGATLKRNPKWLAKFIDELHI